MVSNSGVKDDENEERGRICPPDVVGNVADFTDCSSFYFCPYAIYHKCPDGLVFDTVTGFCAQKDTTDCGDRPYIP